MPFVKTSVTSTAWTLVANNKTSLSAFNVGQNLVYLGFTATNTPPVETVGMPLDLFFGGASSVTKSAIANLTNVVSPKYVWARTASGTSSVIVETD